MKKLTSLCSSGKIGSLVLKNRIVMPGMGTGTADLNGRPTSTMIGYYAERARGGAGLIITEAAYSRPETVPCQPGNKPRYNLLLNTPETFNGLKSLAEAVKKEGGHIALQINHA
ncbi:NADH oxidase, partial [bacterium]|nr:NADH oxidase [bacterium]